MNGNFFGKTGFLKGRRKFPNGISEWKSAFHLLVLTSSGPFGLDRLWFYLPGKSRGNGTSSFHWKFPFEYWREPFTTTVGQPVSNRFLRVNGEQPRLLERTGKERLILGSLTLQITYILSKICSLAFSFVVVCTSKHWTWYLCFGKLHLLFM